MTALRPAGMSSGGICPSKRTRAQCVPSSGKVSTCFREKRVFKNCNAARRRIRSDNDTPSDLAYGSRRTLRKHTGCFDRQKRMIFC